MTNAQKNRVFLATTDARTKADVLVNIADHYGVGTKEAFDEVTGPYAEHLLDYVTGPLRAGVHALMLRSGLD